MVQFQQFLRQQAGIDRLPIRFADKASDPIRVDAVYTFGRSATAQHAAACGNPLFQQLDGRAVQVLRPRWQHDGVVAAPADDQRCGRGRRHRAVPAGYSAVPVGRLSCSRALLQRIRDSEFEFPAFVGCQPRFKIVDAKPDTVNHQHSPALAVG